jgi:hypothetical protein
VAAVAAMLAARIGVVVPLMAPTLVARCRSGDSPAPVLRDRRTGHPRKAVQRPAGGRSRDGGPIRPLVLGKGAPTGLPGACPDSGHR